MALAWALKLSTFAFAVSLALKLSIFARASASDFRTSSMRALSSMGGSLVSGQWGVSGRLIVCPIWAKVDADELLPSSLPERPSAPFYELEAPRLRPAPLSPFLMRFSSKGNYCPAARMWPCSRALVRAPTLATPVKVTFTYGAPARLVASTHLVCTSKSATRPCSSRRSVPEAATTNINCQKVGLCFVMFFELVRKIVANLWRYPKAGL